jgi:hypothetical protein
VRRRRGSRGGPHREPCLSQVLEQLHPAAHLAVEQVLLHLLQQWLGFGLVVVTQRNSSPRWKGEKAEEQPRVTQPSLR